MTTHDVPQSRRRMAVIVGASVAVGLIASVGLQLSGDTEAAVAVVDAQPGDCPAVIAL